MNEPKRRGRPPKPQEIREQERIERLEAIQKARSMDIEEILEQENMTVEMLTKHVNAKDQLHNAQETHQDIPQHVFIDLDEAFHRFMNQEPSEVLIKQFATDKEGTWTPFDMVWLSFPMKTLKFRKPKYNNESTDRGQAREVPLPHDSPNPDASSDV